MVARKPAELSRFRVIATRPDGAKVELWQGDSLQGAESCLRMLKLNAAYARVELETTEVRDTPNLADLADGL